MKSSIPRPQTERTRGPAFPLTIGASRRYFVDRCGTPFLYHADTGWLLFSKLALGEAIEYLDDRLDKRFTAIQAQLLPEEPDQTNRAGDAPFANQGDLTTPGDAYFAHVDRIMERVAERGLLLVIAPLWIGCCGGNWAGTLRANGPANARAYGRYLARRYGRLPNLMWIMGGDNDPHDLRESVQELALGIKHHAPQQLITYHAASTHSSTDVFPDARWLDWSMTYTYFRGKPNIWVEAERVPEVYAVNHAEYAKTPVRPFALGEALYEYPAEDGTPARMRKQAYWSLLSGAMGHAYGSPLYEFSSAWRDYLDLPGAGSLRHFYELLSSRPWHDLVPDRDHALIVDGRGTYGSAEYVTAARTPDGRLALAYLPPVAPGMRRITVDLRRFGGDVSTHWFDPTDGSFLPIEGSPFPGDGPRQFTPPTVNSAGDQDWVLVLEAASADEHVP
jgi:hypothetical protein